MNELLCTIPVVISYFLFMFIFLRSLSETASTNKGTTKEK
jgi:hypothetical protein